MPYSEKLADRVRIALEDIAKVEEKEMFRGLTFMVDDKMCICIGADRIMCRIDPAIHDDLLDQRPCRSMSMKGKEYKGFILVDESDVASNRDLDFWVKCCLDFNPHAKSSKKKKKVAVKVRKTAAAAAGKKKISPAKGKIAAAKKKAKPARKKGVQAKKVVPPKKVGQAKKVAPAKKIGRS